MFIFQVRPKENLSRSSQTNGTVYFVTARQRSCEKVMFSVVSLCLSVCSQRAAVCPLPMKHWTSLYRNPLGYRTSLYRDCQPSLHLAQWTWDFPLCPGTAALLFTSNGQNWTPVQICSPLDQPRAGNWCLQLRSGRYASYWNAFLF